jgi:hypothetical protein
MNDKTYKKLQTTPYIMFLVNAGHGRSSKTLFLEKISMVMGLVLVGVLLINEYYLLDGLIILTVIIFRLPAFRYSFYNIDVLLSFGLFIYLIYAQLWIAVTLTALIFILKFIALRIIINACKKEFFEKP